MINIKDDLVELDEEKFVKIMAGQNLAIAREQRDAVLGLTNLHNASYQEKANVHPLAYSPDFLKHPDMICIPTSYKFSRDLEKKYKAIRGAAKD